MSEEYRNSISIWKFLNEEDLRIAFYNYNDLILNNDKEKLNNLFKTELNTYG